MAANKQESFINHYLQSFNATRAAIAAGYSEQSAYSQGSRLLKNAKVADAIRARINENAMQADEALYHLASIARTDMDDLVSNEGTLDMDKARKYGKTGLIKKMKFRRIPTDSGTILETEIEGHDRLRALELIGKHHKLFTDKQELSGANGGPIPIFVTGMDMDEL